jgi:hypothetical protein
MEAPEAIIRLEAQGREPYEVTEKQGGAGRELLFLHVFQELHSREQGNCEQVLLDKDQDGGVEDRLDLLMETHLPKETRSATA